MSVPLPPPDLMLAPGQNPQSVCFQGPIPVLPVAVLNSQNIGVPNAYYQVPDGDVNFEYPDQGRYSIHIDNINIER